MHVLIINGSPRVKKYSNTNYILEKFTEGLRENGATFEQYEISDRGSWDQIRQAFDRDTVILIALPLYVECIPGLLWWSPCQDHSLRKMREHFQRQI